MGPHPAKVNRANPALHALTDGRFLLALVVLALNDHWWKPSYGNFLTGKLSDVAGLIVLPIVVATIVRLVGFAPRDREVAIAAGCWFGLMKTSVTVAAATERLAEAVTGTSHTIVVDPTDLIGLAGLGVALATLRSPRPLISAEVVRAALLACGLLAIMATSESGPILRNDLVLNTATGEVTAVRGLYTDEMDDGYIEEEPASTADLEGRGIGVLELCDPTQPSLCFWAREDRVVETVDGESRTVWSRDPSGPSRGRVASYYGERRAKDTFITDMLFDREGTLHIVSWDSTRASRSPTGDWTPSFAHFRPIGFVGLLTSMFTLVAVAAVAMRRRAGLLAFLPIPGLVSYFCLVYTERVGSIGGLYLLAFGFALAFVVATLTVVLGGKLSRWWLLGGPAAVVLGTLSGGASEWVLLVLLVGLLVGCPVAILRSSKRRQAGFAVAVTVVAAGLAFLPFLIWQTFIDLSYLWTFAWLVAPAVAMWVVDQLELD